MENLLYNQKSNQINLDAQFEDLSPDFLDLESDISSYANSCSLSTDKPLDQIINMPNETMSLLDMDHVQPELPKKKRGRKPLRPNDPIRTKTEEKDKFWLRAFRSYFRKYVDSVWRVLTDEEKYFLKFYFSANGKPGKKRKFLSYGKAYKSFLFGNKFFKASFKEWFMREGDTVLERKYKPGTNEFFVYYNYCLTELLCYNEEKVSSYVSQPCADIEMENYDELLHQDFNL